MIDIKLIRENTEAVREAMEKVGAEPGLIDRAKELDERWREKNAEVERMRARLNRESKKVKSAPKDVRQSIIDDLRSLGDKIDSLNAEADSTGSELRDVMLNIPNMPDPDVPVGKGEEENVVLRTEGTFPDFEPGFQPRPHWDICTELGIIDFERGAKISGSRFYVLMRNGAKLQRALISWMIDLHVSQHGYTEVYPPAIVQEKCLYGTGNLPKFAENLYKDAEEDLWLIPTAEVPLTNLHREEILSAEDLPLCYTAYTPCFRREKMKAGTDVRGIKRGHQFDKVELMKYVKPENSNAELEKLLDNAEEVCRRLELPYRITQMCTGDLSFVAAKKYDIEIWAAGCEEWLEVSSCSNFRDFQARRAEIRYRPAPQEKPEYLHTINGSGLALPRVMIAVIENYQQPDGSVTVPDILRPYMGGLEKICET